jgi:hypothetical protein
MLDGRIPRKALLRPPNNSPRNAYCRQLGSPLLGAAKADICCTGDQDKTVARTLALKLLPSFLSSPQVFALSARSALGRLECRFRVEKSKSSHRDILDRVPTR